MKDINVDEEVRQFIVDTGKDYRVSTSCYGPVMVPVEMKAPKVSDIRIRVGENTLYISKVQAMYIDRVTSRMIFEPEYLNACPAIRGL